jgi:FAD/FMN-containing dehydrogenase
VATILGEGTLEELRQAIRGEVVTPGDPGYDAARSIWNGMIDRRPRLIIRCSGVGDVVSAIQFARSQDVEVAVRGGGHSLPGFSTVDDGLVIDLRAMNGIQIDPDARRVVVQGGATWGEVDHDTQAFGLAVTGGLVSTTGVAGFTLGGGIGWLMRRYGLACDNLVAVDLVTADGRLVHASESEHPELLWGLRGGGGNFGVVTSFEFQLHRVGPTVFAGPVFYPGDQAAQVLRGWRACISEVPDEMTTLVNLGTAPPLPFLPDSVHGQKVVVVVSAYCGPLHEAAEIAAPLRRLGDPIADLVGEMPYTAIQSLVDPLFAPGARNYFTSRYLNDLPDAAIDRLVRLHGPAGSPTSEIHLHQMGGAVARVSEDATAYGNRRARFVVNVAARWADPATDDSQMQWAHEVRDAIEPFGTGGAYVNFLGVGDDGARVAYGGNTRARLAAVKAIWDPTNVFRLNQNIQPAAQPTG